MSFIPLIVATGNPGKVAELWPFFADLPRIPGIPNWQPQLKPPELELVETGSTFVENAAQKAVQTAQFTGSWAIADDSGLCVEALSGAPGIYSARYAETDQARIAKLLTELDKALREQGRDPHNPIHRQARFECAIALCDPLGSLAFSVTGSCPGYILEDPQGSGGFGYDPIFYVPDTKATFAGMDPQTKARLSHRGRALAALKEALLQGIP